MAVVTVAVEQCTVEEAAASAVLEWAAAPVALRLAAGFAVHRLASEGFAVHRLTSERFAVRRQASSAPTAATTLSDVAADELLVVVIATGAVQAWGLWEDWL
jgi:hypothetical protein